jgi:beta-aspartyl-peptidase (threonine type)
MGPVGDSPLIGASTYADDRSAAVSATGSGEYFIRTAAAHEVSARLRIGGQGLQQALEECLRKSKCLAEVGGLIAVSHTGEAACSFTTPAMYRGTAGPDGSQVAIYADELER